MFNQIRISLCATSIAFCLLNLLTDSVMGWEKEEHKFVADMAFAEVLIENSIALQDLSILPDDLLSLAGLSNDIERIKTFGEISAFFSGKDISRSRLHERGKTVLQQLRPLSSAVIAAIWYEHGIGDAAFSIWNPNWPVIHSAEQSDRNVVSNFLLHHLIALRYAKFAGQSTENKEALSRALIYEAMALSYLSDAFSASHQLVPLDDFLSGFHPINNKQAHDFYRNEGVYVINSNGEVWQTFGDEIMQWYAPTYRHVLDACKTSLREVFLVYYSVSGNSEIPNGLQVWWQSTRVDRSPKDAVEFWTNPHSGDEYYIIGKLPSLLLVPIPVSATWSVRTEEKDKHGIHRRIHFPQLQEFHDPDLEGIDTEFLYSKSAFPTWLIPDSLFTKEPSRLIKSELNYASVRYVQERHFPPSYVGLLMHTGGGLLFDENDPSSTWSAGLGYGMVDEFLVLRNLSFDLTLMPSFSQSRRSLISPTVGIGSVLPRHVSGVIEAVHIEVGYAWGLRRPFRAHGSKIALGVDSSTIPLGFTYAGIVVRAKYQWLWLENTLNGVFLEFVLH